MNTEQILEHIDAELSRLEQVKKLLSGNGGSAKAKPAKFGRPKSTPIAFVAKKAAAKKPAKRTMSDEGRARIAAAQKARWAKQKKSA